MNIPEYEFPTLNVDEIFYKVVKRRGFAGNVSSGKPMLSLKPLRDDVFVINHNGAWGFQGGMANSIANELRMEGLAVAVAGDRFNKCLLVSVETQIVEIASLGHYLLTKAGSAQA